MFALGEIYTVRSTKPRGNGVPGISFFLKALDFFQDLYEEPTVEYIETLLLLVSWIFSCTSEHSIQHETMILC